MNNKDSFDILWDESLEADQRIVAKYKGNCTKIVQELAKYNCTKTAPKMYKKCTSNLSDFDLVRNWTTSFKNYIDIKHLTERNLNTIEHNLTKYDNETTNEEM